VNNPVLPVIVSLAAAEIVRERQATIERAREAYIRGNAAWTAFRDSDAGRKAAAAVLSVERELLARIAERIDSAFAHGCKAILQGQEADAFKDVNDGFAEAAAIWQQMLDRSGATRSEGCSS
jgi:hypothetical protein